MSDHTAQHVKIKTVASASACQFHGVVVAHQLLLCVLHGGRLFLSDRTID